MNLSNEICALGGELGILKILLSKKYVSKKDSRKVLLRLENVYKIK